jgi:hypothetical protein
VRLFALFLDEYHVSSGANTDRVRDALLRFVDRDLTPRDLVVVMKPLDSIFAIRLSGDLDAVRQAIQTFEGRKGQFEPRNAYERNFIAGTPARIEAIRNQVAWSAINALAVHMGGLVDARKTLIVVSENMGGPERRRGLEYLATRDTVLRSANRANVAILHRGPGRRCGRSSRRRSAADAGAGDRRRYLRRRSGRRPQARGRRFEPLLPAHVPFRAPRRWTFPRGRGADDPRRHPAAREEGDTWARRRTTRFEQHSSRGRTSRRSRCRSSRRHMSAR